MDECIDGQNEVTILKVNFILNIGIKNEFLKVVVR